MPSKEAIESSPPDAEFASYEVLPTVHNTAHIDEPLPTSDVVDALRRGRQALLDHQHPDGHWCAPLEGDSILESETILFYTYMGQLDLPRVPKLAQRLLDTQNSSGGWSMYPDGPTEISATVKAYFALKICGHDPDAPHMQRARQEILAHGGADKINSFSRFYLALLGQIPYTTCPFVPPEMVLLPSFSPLHLGMMSSWSRTMFVPLAIVSAKRPVVQLPPEQGISELFVKPPTEWAKTSGGLDDSASPSARRWRKFFLFGESILRFLDQHKLTPFRKLALRRTEQWILDRLPDSDGLGAIYPGVIWSVISLKCCGHDNDSPPVADSIRELEKLVVEGRHSARVEPCRGPVWDTAIALRALVQANQTLAREMTGPRENLAASAARRAAEWLLEKQIHTPGDWSARNKAEPGCWAFEYQNRFYPDVDDTSMVSMALVEQSAAMPAKSPSEHHQHVTTATKKARDWMVGMQNRDGGWGAFDKDNDCKVLCYVPFADHNAMIDPSTPDLAARVIESFAILGYGQEDPSIQKCLAYLRKTQEHDGAWFGRWGVNYIYGTWQTLVGLKAVGIPSDDPLVQAGVDWLLKYQQPCGGWGETADSYEDPTLRGTGEVTPSQTAWALLGLLAAGHAQHPAVQRGIRWLLDHQNGDGTWDEGPFTGTGFPRVFYLKYHDYALYFPLMALAQFRQATQPASSGGK